MTQTTDTERPKLKRSLGTLDLLLYGIVFMSPIAGFAVYGFVQDSSGDMAVLSYLIGCIGMVLTGLSYAAMSRAAPGAGSVYNYAQKAFGPFLGFAAGWSILLDYVLLPSLMLLIAGLSMNAAIPAVPVAGWVMFFLVIATVTNLCGIKFTTRADMMIAGALMIAVTIFVIAAVIYLLSPSTPVSLSLSPLLPEGGVQMNLVVAGASVAILSFLGFDAISTLSEELKEGHSNAVGRATILCLVVMASIFIVESWLLSDLSKGLEDLSPDAAAFEIINARMPFVGLIVTLAVGLGTGFGSTIPPQAAVSRVLFAMARDRQLPGILSRVHSRFRSPYVAILFMAVIMAVLSLGFGAHLDTLLSLVNYGALMAFMFVNASVIMHYGIRGGSRQLVRHWILPGIGFLVVAYVFTGLSSQSLIMGTAWIVAGIAFYLVQRFMLGRTPVVGLDAAE
ncbi:APC family permease [Celeribacter sp.]|uniref:APC family permease n=1 Tax=Celeribacter sp. TaxID=1890673 RepID=UPI003A9388EB